MMKVTLPGFLSLLAKFGISQETGEGQIFLPKKWNERMKYASYFYSSFWKNIAKPKELFGSCILKKSSAISKYREGNYTNTQYGVIKNNAKDNWFVLDDRKTYIMHYGRAVATYWYWENFVSKDFPLVSWGEAHDRKLLLHGEVFDWKPM